MRWKRLSWSWQETLLCQLVLVGLLLRVVLIMNNWPTTNSDEGTMGLMGMHIAYKGEHPVFYYGQAYMGALEAYLAALIFPIAGNSLQVLRFALLPFYALFLISVYLLTRLLYSKGLALFSVTLLVLGSSEIILHQLRAIGGYPEIVVFAALMFLFASWLALSADTSWRRWLVAGLWGFTVGLAIWDDQIVLPFVAGSGLLLWLFCRKTLWGWTGLCLLAGLLVGMAPLLYHNLTAPLEQNSLVVLYSLQNSNSAELAVLPALALRKLIGALLIALPAITGLNPLCQAEQFPLFGPTTAQTWQCSIQAGGWSLVYLLLWGLAAFSASRWLWQFWRTHRKNRTEPVEATSQVAPSERPELALQTARLLLLLSSLLTLLLYMRSSAAALYPGPTSRYLICMQVALPAQLWPLWQALVTRGKAWDTLTNGVRQSLWRARFRAACSAVLFVLIASFFLAGTVRTFAQIPAAQAEYQQKEMLSQDLLRLGVTRFYSDYFNTCNRLILQSNEQLICSSLDEQLRPGFDRYLPYRDAVRNAPHPPYTYVFALGSPQQLAIEKHLTSSSCQRTLLDGYILYQCARDVSSP